MLTLNDGRKELYQWDTGRIATVDIDCDIVHFSNLKYGDSLAVEVKEGEVAIPNKLLMSGEPIYCWAFVEDDNGAYTKKEQTISVTKRAKPSDYVYTETEVITIKTAVEKALEEAKESGDFKGEKGDKGDKGDDGYTPQKGVDYFTPEDIAELNIPSVDQTYSPISENAQSGKAVAPIFANALKSTVMGSVVVMKDISPIEHDLKVKLSGEIEDFSNVIITKQGKNLFDGSIDLGLKLQKKVVTEAKPEDYGYKIIKSKPNTNYTVSWYGNYFADDDVIRLGTFTEYPKIGDVANQHVYKDTNLADSFSFTTGDNDNYLFVYFIRYNKTEGIELQIEEGNVSTEYEPYIEPQETPANADGTVDGIKSAYPSISLFSNRSDVVIECEYNKDINKAFAALEAAIATNNS